MPLYTSHAIVIRSIPYGESDRIITFFTKNFGKVKAIAKGARRSKKRFQNALDLFTYVRLIFFEREGMGLARAEGCDILNSFPNIREDLEKILYGNYFLELMNEMAVEREQHPEAFELLLHFLTLLNREAPTEDYLRIFEIRMLSLFGYRPNLRNCVICKKGMEELKEVKHLFFSLEKGSLVCEGCAKNWNNLIPLSLGTARLVDEITRIDLSRMDRLKFTPQALLESHLLLPRFIAYQLGKELKSLKVLKERHSFHSNLQNPNGK